MSKERDGDLRTRLRAVENEVDALQDLVRGDARRGPVGLEAKVSGIAHDIKGMGAAVGPLLAQVPGVEDLSAFDQYGVPAILVGVIVTLGFLFYKRVIVWGSTSEKLIENERLQKEAAISDKNEYARTVVRIADDFSGHLRAVLHELGDKR